MLMEIVLGRVIREKLRKANGRERVRERKREMGEREKEYTIRDINVNIKEWLSE